MFSLSKRVFAVSVVVLFIAVTILSVLPPKIAAAIERNDFAVLQKMCVPPLTYNSSNDSYAVDKWLKVQVIDRATLKLIYTPNGNCEKPKDAPSEFLYKNSSFSSLLSSGYLIDRNSGDDNINYRAYSGNDDGRDDTTVRGFAYPFAKDPAAGDNGRDTILAQSKMKGFLDPTLITLSFEQSDAGIGEICMGVKPNFTLGDSPQGPEWQCSQGGIDGFFGIRIGGSGNFTNIENFNITYYVEGNGSATKIVHVSEDQRTTRTFSWCPKLKEFRSGSNCSGNMSINSTPEIMASLEGGDREFDIDVDGKDSFRVSVAGPSSESANAPKTSTELSTGRGLAGDESVGCAANGFNLSWIMCPFVEGLADASDKIFDSFIQPLLKTNPIDLNNPDDPTFAIWKSFRLIGNIILIIALLVIVFSQSIGGGLVDAYAAKKIMPRLLVAAILINLSIYLVSIALDITNILGEGLRKLILSPLYASGNGNIELSTFLPLGFSLLVGAIFGGGVLLASTGGLGAVFLFLLLFIFLPGFLAVVAALFTLILRQGIIIFLVIVSPIAFALYCLPNTEQYFKKWWNALLKTLLVYPIIVAVLAVSNVLAVTLGAAGKNKDPLTDILFDIIKVACLILPLFLIPFAFKLAGGIIGTVASALTGYGKRSTEAIKGNPNDPRSLRNRTRYRGRSAVNEARNVGYSALSDKSKIASGNGSFRRSIYGRAAKALNYGNLQAERATMNEDIEKGVASQYSMGDDANIRAYWAVQHAGKDETLLNEKGKDVGRKVGGWYSPYENPDGSYKEWSPTDVAKARALVRGDTSVMQSYGKYEFGKAANGGQLGAFKQRFVDMANENGWAPDQANGVWAGIKFAHQHSRKEEKYTSIAGEKGSLRFGEVDHAGLSNELADTMRKGDYASFRPETAVTSLNGFRSVEAKIKSGNYTAEDKFIYDNYQDVADHLDSSLFGFGATSEAARQASAQAAAAAAESGETPDATGFGIGASARAEQAWRDFTSAARRNPAGGSSRPQAPSTPGGL